VVAVQTGLSHSSSECARLVLSATLACILLATSAQATSDTTHVVRNATVSVSHPITRGESFAAILQHYGVTPRHVAAWERAARQIANIHRLEVGHDLTLRFVAGGHLVGLRYELDDVHQLTVERGAGSQLTARLEDIPSRVRVVGVRGTIPNTFYRAAQGAGLPDPIVARMVDLLSAEIDFDSDVQPGDRFRVLYEERTRLDGRRLPPGRILAADFVGRTRSAAAFLFRDDDGTPVYVDAKGRLLEQSLLRYPVDFSRISSSFSYSRFHPILNRQRPHFGVDFAAPAGTPVRAAASGTVVWAGWKGDFGYHVEIDHGGSVVSTYSHLRAIDRAVRETHSVRQGQRIGWVGQTGLATGPHLHYAVFDEGRYLNPLTRRGITQPESVDPYEFKLIRTSLMHRLRTIPGGHVPVPSTAPVVLSALAQARRLGAVILTL